MMRKIIDKGHFWKLIRESAVKWSILPFLISMKNIKFYVKRFLYFESNARKVTIYTQNGEHYTFNGKLSEIEQKCQMENNLFESTSSLIW